VPTRGLIDQVHERFDALARAKGVELITALEPGAEVVQADSEKLIWVLLQLVDNAVKFTPGGGRVGVRVELMGCASS